MDDSPNPAPEELSAPSPAPPSQTTPAPPAPEPPSAPEASAEAPPEAVADLLAAAALGDEAATPAEPEPAGADAAAAAEPEPPVALADLLAESALPTPDEAEPQPAAGQPGVKPSTIEESSAAEPVEASADSEPPLPGNVMEENEVTPETEPATDTPESAPAAVAAGEDQDSPQPAIESAQSAEAPPVPEPVAPETAASAAEPAGAPAESDSEAEPHLPTQPPEPPPSQSAAQLPEPMATMTPRPSAPPQAPPHPAIKKEDGPDTSPVSVFVDHVYEGPFDLLLDLIRKQDIDIYDIPIAKITAQFLTYVNHLKASDMDVAGEFIYTASLLIHIKSKMLLPRNPSGPGEEAEDPRRELVERLLEHERFKNAAQMLQQKQMLESASWTNPGLRDFRDDTDADPEIAADTVDLVRIFREILERARSRPVINVQEDSVTVGQMIQFLGRRLTMEDKPVALRRLLAHTKSERALIAMFLALLELVRLQAILLRQDRQFSDIFIKKSSGFDGVMNQGLARDDWQ